VRRVPEPPAVVGDDDVDRLLTDLQRASEERTAELKAIAAQLPALVGRRAMIRALLGDLRANPNKAEIARRGLAKVAATPRRARKELRARVRRDA
jgi:hypothetical protein